MKNAPSGTGRWGNDLAIFDATLRGSNAGANLIDSRDVASSVTSEAILDASIIPKKVPPVNAYHATRRYPE